MSKTTPFAPKPLAVVIGALCTSFSVFADTTPIEADEQLVVTATRTQMELKDAPASMSVITAEDIENDPGITLADIVSNATSVESDFDSTRAGRQQISIRGMDSKYTLIMVNGRRMSSASAIVRGNDFDLSAIPMDSIERVEIIRGPMSALYGSDGMGGTINIITKSPDNDWSSQLSLDNTSPNDGNGGQEYTVGLTTSGALIEDTLFARFSASQTSRNAWQPYSGIKEGTTQDREQVTALEDRDSLALFGTLSWHLTDNQFIDLDLGYSDDERFSIAEAPTKIMDPSEARVKRNSQALSHTGFWSWGDTQVRYSRENVENIEAANDGADSIEELTQIFEASATTYFGESHTVTFGVDYQLSELNNPENLSNGKADAYQAALYAQDQWEMTDTLTATIGGRLDKHEQFGEEFSPRVYLVHQTTDDLVLKGGVGKAFKAPTLTQNRSDFLLTSCKGACKLEGNEDLEAETSINYELSALYSNQRFSLESTIFRNEIENLIERTDETFCRTGSWSDADGYCVDANGDKIEPLEDNQYKTYHNVSKAVIQGVELSGRVQLAEEWSMSGNYTYLDTEDKSTGEELSERYKHSAYARLNWTPSQDLNLFASARYRGDRRIDAQLSQDAYTTMDLGTVYHVNDALRIRAGITNVTDERVSKELEEQGYVEAPRTYYVGMTADF
ncbi:TonB-dependent receptor domain-containing protein [Vibrio harveyi]|uniref:TonB-dependent receptor n=1 Tax=Vibrio harveyi TaxID=669 RepID=A0ABM5Y3C8_VIBHA|nr:TonB-dependent receptor [Vibrio harveyi]AMG00019.1 TonB-dependent receptor [Vibrio harveyi]AWB02564.1 TonB-dependent receptor [Vibrio harveyi]EKO3842487.1 TonB-dependent receptor [Vibrio harveyi]EKO3862626.1 TonB-dependent receptor [Vibrio harveyi]ELY1986920.1 TonB-dependent receptor [Vibrio harveyi]